MAYLYIYMKQDYDNKATSGYVRECTAEDSTTGKFTVSYFDPDQWEDKVPDYWYNNCYARTIYNNDGFRGTPIYMKIKGINGYGFQRIRYYSRDSTSSSYKYFDTYPDDPSAEFDLDLANNYTNSYTSLYLQVDMIYLGNSVKYELSHCTINTEPDIIEQGETVEYIITADDSCYFEEIPYISYNDTIEYFTLNEDKTIATLTHYFDTTSIDYTIIANAESNNSTIDYDLTHCTVEPNDSELVAGSIVDYKLTTTPDGNYVTCFYETPYIETDDDIFYFTISEDLQSATLSLEVGTKKEYHLVAVAERKNCNVTIDIDNCYFESGTTFTEDTVTKAGTGGTIFCRANEDYYFTNEESLGLTPSLINANTGDVISEFTLSERTTINGTYYYKYISYGFSITDDSIIYCHAINPDDFVYCSCTENLTNVYTHSHADTYLKGSRATIEVYVPSAYTSVYKINDLPEIQFANGNVLYFEVDEDGLNASITFTVEDDFIIYAHAERPKVYHNVIAENLTHCRLTSADTFEEQDYYTLELTADDGYVFNDNIECRYNTLTTYITGDEFYEDDTIARHTFIPTLWSDIEVIEAVAIRQAEQVSNFAHLYKVTASILNSLAKVRFYEVSSETAEVVDYGEYITNLMEIPFSLPDDIIGDNANIQLGTFDSGVSAPTLLYHSVDFDIGTISVKSKYDNVYDYKDTEAILHLPYAEDITVPLEYVMNETLNIVYRMDLYSGDVTIILTSTYTGTVVATQNTNICTQIPFIQYQTDSVMNKIDKLTDNGIRTAFIELKRNIPYNVFCEFGKPTVDYGKLSDYKGYVEVSDCTVNIACTKDEQDLIKQTLRTGIIIK